MLDHSSITHIKTTPKYQISPLTSFNKFSGTNTKEIFKLLSTLDKKKSVGLDTIPPKLVKIAAIVFLSKKEYVKKHFSRRC